MVERGGYPVDPTGETAIRFVAQDVTSTTVPNLTRWERRRVEFIAVAPVLPCVDIAAAVSYFTDVLASRSTSFTAITPPSSGTG